MFLNKSKKTESDLEKGKSGIFRISGFGVVIVGIFSGISQANNIVEITKNAPVIVQWILEFLKWFYDIAELFSPIFCAFILCGICVLWIDRIKMEKAGNTESFAEIINNLNDHDDNLKIFCKDCENNIKQIYRYREQMQNCGILEVHERQHYNNDYYRNLYGLTKKEIIITGHSLNTTINSETAGDLRIAFKAAVIRVLIQKGTVKILLQTPNRSRGALKKRDNFEKFLREVVEELDSKAGISQEELKEMKQNLIIKQVSSLRYFIVQTEMIH